MTQQPASRPGRTEEVGRAYAAAAGARQDALVGGLPRMGGHGARLTDSVVLAVLVAAVLLLVNEITNWFGAGTDVLIGLVAGCLWWFVGRGHGRAA